MVKTKRYLPVLLLLILLGLVFTFPSFLFNFLIKPLAVILWAAWRMVLTVDQSTYWLILMLLCLLLMVRFVSLDKKRAIPPAYHYKTGPVSRIEYWQGIIEKSLSGSEENSDLRDSLEKLVLSALAASQHHAVDGLEVASTESISLPPEVARYLSSLQKKHGLSPFYKHLNFLNGKAFRKRTKNSLQPVDASMDEVLRWMENYLEINHDR